MFRRILPFYWALCFWLTHKPTSPLPPLFPGVDKVVHFVGYGVLGFLLRASRLKGLLEWQRIVLTILGYALFDELTQPLVGRQFEVADLVADTLGASLGVWTSWKIGLGPRGDR